LQIESNGVAPLYYLNISIRKRVSILGGPCLFSGFGTRFQLFGVVYGAGSGLCYRVWYCGVVRGISDLGYLYCYSAERSVAYSIRV